MTRILKTIFYLDLLIVVLLIGYDVYLNFVERDFQSVHSRQVEQIESTLKDDDAFRFAVVGNANNSIGIFERQIIPMINAAGVDFTVSAGNAVSGGGEDKYRALYRTLQRLDAPYLLTFGEKEASNFGEFRFYEHFGPYFFSFTAGNSRFIFLDSTGTTAYSWQLHWLEDALAASSGMHTFVFIDRLLRPVQQDTFFDEQEHYVDAPAARGKLTSLIERHRVDAVFSANLPVFAHDTHRGTDYVVTGGGGGLVLNNDTSFYHYVEVTVDKQQVDIVLRRLDIGQNRLFETLEGLWFWIHSLFYVGYLHFLLIVGVFVLIGTKLYARVFVNRDYYPDFSIDPAPYLDKPLRAALFTNNYLPFIGGVPISIDRLRRGLTALGEHVLIVAPRYRDQSPDEPDVLRVPALFSFGEKREFRLANLFLPGIGLRVKAFKPDVIHLHHPFWLGSLGLFLARRLGVPAVYNYHTRLEHYAHFVPLPTPLFRNLISHALIKRFSNRCDAVIVPTEACEQYLRVIGVKSDIFVQPTGIDYRRFQEVESGAIAQLRQKLGIGDEPVIVSVSRLSKEKNIDFMLEAAHALHERNAVAFRFLIIGDGNERARLQARIDELNLHDRVTLTGAIAPDDIPVYYRLADLFAFASKSETQGMVILEAMAAGLPVVAVRSSGIDDVVRDGFNGFKTLENLDQWREAVRRLLTDAGLRERLATNAHAFAADYDIAPYARSVKAVYAHVIAAARSRRNP